MNSFSAEKTDEEKAEEHELDEVKKSAREDLFQFMGPIVQLVISFELSLANGTSSCERNELKISEIVIGTTVPRLGLMRIKALELLDKLHLCYGIRMLEVFREADLYNSLLKFYALYPYNDIALRFVTSILAYSLDNNLAKTLLAWPAATAD